jgi:predicted ester cyclase
MSRQRNKDVARLLFEEIIANNASARLSEIIAADATDRTQPGVTGPAAFRAHIAFVHGRIGQPEITVTDLIAEGERVVVYWRMVGTHNGTLFGVAATGRRLDGTSISTITFRDGLIIHYDVLPDRQAFITSIAA